MTKQKMTVTNEGVKHVIDTTRYHYFEYKAGILFPKSVVFRATFIGSTYIQDLRFVDWMGMMLNNKIVVSSKDAPIGEYVKNLSILTDPILIVENTSPEYITTTFFNILNSLLAEDSRIISLQWVN